MRKPTPTIEWQIAESDTEWLQLCAAAAPSDPALTAPVSSAARHAERRLALLLVLLFALLAGGWGWQRHAAQAAFAHDLQMTIAQETQAQRAGLPMPAPVPVPVPAGPPLAAGGAPQVTIDDYEQVGERVMAQVTVRSPAADGQVQAYRQTRFYRQVDEEWQRIDPDPALLGPQQSLRTAHFRFAYRALDAAAVAAAAPRLERLYGQLRRDFGLAASAASQVIAVEVSTAKQSTVRHAQRTLVVPSPALLSVPMELTADDALYQALVYRLASLLVSEVIAQYPPSWQGGAVYWWPLLSALPLWALWGEGGPLAMGQPDILRWLLHNAHAATPAAQQAVPAGYARLCQTYAVWQILPAELSIPLYCTAIDEQGWPQRVALALPLALPELAYAGGDPVSVPAPSMSASQVLGMETVIEYVVATYGRDALPRLLTALGEYASWRTLSPAVFGVSAEEFEAGWLAFLEIHYGKPTAP